ncbi:MAG: YfhO family protein [Clostridia bacterium]|nr:YfhO family protein [Clostridia bacterium]
MSKLKNFIKNNRYIFLSGLLAFLTMTLILIAHKVSPFGERTILRMDLYHQYGPLFSELKNIYAGNGNFFYSFLSGGGSAFLGNYFNYLSSPFNLLVMFFPKIHISNAIALMLVCKVTLISSFFAYYIKNSTHIKLNSPMTIGFSLMYAFCGFIIAYYWNIMWIDALYMLPLVILGLEKIIENRSPNLYVFSLFFTIFFNYYMGFMICIFTLIYFFSYFFFNFEKSNAKQFFSSILRYILYSIVTFGLSCIVLLPIISILKTSSATGDNFPSTLNLGFEFLDFIANHLVSLEPTIRSSGSVVLPNIYSGMAIFILIPIFFLNDKISFRKKASVFSLILILFLSMNINFLNFIWHGLHFPNDLPYRFSFIYSFVLVQAAVYGFVNLDKKSEKKAILAFAFTFLLIIIIQKETSKNVSDLTIYLSIIFALIYCIFFIKFIDFKNMEKLISIVFVVLVISEITAGSLKHFEINQNKADYMSGYSEFYKYHKKLKNENQSLFYREEMLYSETKMNPSLYGYNGISLFSSMANENVARLQCNLGLAGNYINSYTYSLQTPLYNSLFSIKYLYNNMPGIKPSTDYYASLDIGAKYNVLENKYYLPPILPVNKDIKKFKSLKHRPFVNQQAIFENMGFEDELFTEIEFDDFTTVNLETEDDNSQDLIKKYRKTDSKEWSTISTNFSCEETGNYYVYFASRGLEAVDIFGNDGLSLHLNLNEPSLIDLGKLEKGDEIHFNFICKDDEIGVELFSKAKMFNEKAFNLAFDKLLNKASGATIQKNTIQNEINVGEDEVVLTSLPYDDGWQIYVDDKKIDKKEYLKIDNALLAFKCPSGQHRIKLKYFPQGVIIGDIVFVISLIALFLLSNYEKNRSKNKNE